MANKWLASAQEKKSGTLADRMPTVKRVSCPEEYRKESFSFFPSVAADIPTNKQPAEALYYRRRCRERGET